MSSRIGDYEILHEIKTGGMGEVLLGSRRGPGAFEKVVAIKTIRAELADAPHMRAMFLDEAATLARLNHPSVAHVHEFGDEGGVLYMVMEYVAGVPFRQLAELRAPASVIARAVAAAARGLHAAHEACDLTGQPLGLVHRDISPDNLLLAYDGHVKVIDFGIALVRNRQAAVTELGTLKGKPPYMSPEQVKNEPLDRRSDVFSLGVVAWELLTRRRLFDGDSVYAVARAVEHQEITPPSANGAVVPRELDAAVMRALERDPDRRPASARELASDLERAVTDADDTLESWASSAFEHPREQHARWLAALLTHGSVESPPAPVVTGRPTGELTVVAHVNASKADRATQPRPRIIALALCTVAVLAGGLYSMMRHPDRDHRADSPSPPTATVAEVAVLQPLRDASVDDSAVADAASTTPSGGEAVATTRNATPVDRTKGRHKAPARRPEPAHVTVPVPSEPTGNGFVTVRYKPGPYANITLDSGGSLPGPIFKRKIAAGKHVITFLDPVTGDVLDRQEVVVTANETANVVQH